MISNSDERKLFLEVKARFPETFGLRGFPGEVFRISDSSSYFNGPVFGPIENKALILYTERVYQGEWRDFAKGTESELRAQLVK